MQDGIVSFRLNYNWTIIIFSYFVLQILSRVFVGGGLGIDEAELMLTAKTLEWGYGAQPPFYSWVQHGIFSLIGENIFSLSVVKNSFLCLTYLGLYRLLCCQYKKEIAGLATISLIFLPQISWESQRALSHSVLATSMTVITFLIFMQLTENRKTWLYVLFGVSVALGTLSKLNFLIFPIAMLTAAISLSSIRETVIDARILITSGVASAILLKPILWMVSHQNMVMTSVAKFSINADVSKLESAWQGFLSLAVAGVSFLAILIVVLVFLYFKYGENRTVSSHKTPLFQLLLRTVVVALFFTLVLVLCSGTTNVKDRWLQPVLVLAAPMMTLWVLPKLSGLGRHRFVQMVYAVALLVFIVLPAHDIRPSRRSAPFPAVISAVVDRHPKVKTIFAENKWIGGNFRYLKKEWEIGTPESNFEALRGDVVLVWGSCADNVPASMINRLEAQNKRIILAGPITTIEANYSLKSKSMLTMYFVSALIE